MTFEAALRAALLILGLSPDVHVDRMYDRWAPYTLSGDHAAAWTYETVEPGVFAVGINIEWDKKTGDWLRQFTASHEACHIKLHAKWIKAPPSSLTMRQVVLNELLADRCAIWVMGVKAGDDSADEPEVEP